MDKIPMTVNGARLLREEIDKLTRVERPRIVADIAEALAQGDLRENAEFQYAKEEQGFIEGRIADIAGKLSNVHIIDITEIAHTGKVIFGVTVTMLNIETEKEVTYQIVGEDEADIKSGKLSVYSPIARAMVGKSEGDEIVVKAPSGDIEYEICKVEHK
jgi:transcription elongation factor GreA